MTPDSYAGTKTGVAKEGALATERARELVALLREDTRAAMVPSGGLPVSEASVSGCTGPQCEFLYAACALLKFCHKDDEAGPRKSLVAVCNAFLEHPVAIDQLLCVVVCCPPIGPGLAEAEGLEGADDYFDGRADAKRAADRCEPSPPQVEDDFYVLMLKGPVGLLHELFTHASHPVLQAFAESTFFPKTVSPATMSTL